METSRDILFHYYNNKDDLRRSETLIRLHIKTIKG